MQYSLIIFKIIFALVGMFLSQFLKSFSCRCVCVCICDQTCHTFVCFMLVLHTNPDLIIRSTSQKRLTYQEIAAE